MTMYYLCKVHENDKYQQKIEGILIKNISKRMFK